MGDLDPIRRFLDQEGIVLCFHGPFRHSILEELARAVRSHLAADAAGKPALADVFMVLVEAGQNVATYTGRAGFSPEQRALAQNGVLVVGRNGDRYQVHCGNFLLPRDGADLQARLVALAALDAAGLKALYKERLHAATPAGATGAGLGLIRMARTASQPLAYRFAPGPRDLDFFSLSVTL